MKTPLQTRRAAEPVNILVVGNNPIEMGYILDKLNQVNAIRVITEIAFDVRSILERLAHFNPGLILIDDNLGRPELKEVVSKLAAGKKTKDIPITILKNSNYRESLAASSILDYLLKHNLSPESLYRTIQNTLRFRRTQQLLTAI
jgi:CheY-like chemotaxis protein